MASVTALGWAVVGCSAATRAFAQAVVPPDQCPAQGTATGAAGQALNLLKNRATAPTDAQIAPRVTLNGMLADGDDTGRFDQGQGAEITGYVIKVQQGGRHESANCGNSAMLATDTHITVGSGPNSTEAQSLVVEVTPKWRMAMQKRGVDWRTETLQATLVGHRVQFRGWLMFDTQHAREAVNTAPANPQDWRKTVWEIHPITAMQIVQ
jgi:hypothetical protein